MDISDIDHKKLLQLRIEELGSAIININKGKTDIDGFASEEMLDYWNKGINCRQSQGQYIVNDEKYLDFSRSCDDALMILLKDNIEKARYQYVPLFRGIIKYDSYANSDLEKDSKKSCQQEYLL